MWRARVMDMSSPCSIAWMTEPDAINNSALKKACVIRWNAAAIYAPMPSAANMKPSCEMVEKASTFLTSFCATAMVAANSAVKPPTIAISSSGEVNSPWCASPPAVSSGNMRMIM